MNKWLIEGWFEKDLKIRNIVNTTYEYLHDLKNPFKINNFTIKQNKIFYYKKHLKEREKRIFNSEKFKQFKENKKKLTSKCENKWIQAPKSFIENDQISTSYDIDVFTGLSNFNIPEKRNNKFSNIIKNII